MSTYFMFAKNAFRQKLIYRANTVIYMISSMMYLLIQFNIWQALYATRIAVENVSLNQMLTYCVINRLTRAFLNDQIGKNLGAKIRSGEIGGDFIRPINLKLYLIADQIGNSCYDFFFNFIPIIITTVAFGAFLPPVSVAHGLMFTVSLALGITLYYYINYILGLIAFWIKNNGFVGWLMGAMMLIFAGSEIPIWFYPSVLKNIAALLPFRFITYEPISVYLGMRSIEDTLFVVGMQVFWILVAYVLGRIVWIRAEKRVIVQGG